MTLGPTLGFSAESVATALGRLRLPADELDQLTESLTERHRSVARCRRELVGDASGPLLPFATTPVPWYRLGRQVAEPDVRPASFLAFAAGEYYLQDAGSLLALAACNADTDQLRTGISENTESQTHPESQIDGGAQEYDGPLVCDLCASPGGKASALVEAIGGSGFVLANEPIRSRLAPLTFNLNRTGSDRWAVSSLDPHRLAARLPATFDLVLVDAPCSGQALLSRGRQSEAALSLKQIEYNAARQRRILEAAVALLKPGGQLVYSTCTFAEQENEAQAEWLTATLDVQAAPVQRLASHASPISPACYRLWPQRDQCAGSFAASFQSLAQASQNGPSETVEAVAAPPKKKRRGQRQQATRPPAEPDLTAWYNNIEASRRHVSRAVVVGWPVDSPAWIESVAVAGPELAHQTGQTWKPSHAGALRRDLTVAPSSRVEVDQEQARQFVAGHPIASAARGWRVVMFEGRPLGWIKGNGSTGKNHLPGAARLQLVPERF